jgi:four helix bundle protein
MALEECDETLLWLELIGESGLLPMKRLSALQIEANELTAILFTTFRSSKNS